MAGLLEVLLPLDRIQLSQRRLEKLRGVADDDSLDLGPGLRLGDVVPEQVEGHDGLHARVVPQDLELPRGQDRIRLDDDCASSEDREERHHEVRRVREEEGHAVAGANANRPETGREPVDRGIEVAIRQRLPIECDRGSVAVLSRGPTEQVLHRDIRIGEGPGQVGGPTGKPRPLQRGRLSHRCSIGGAIEKECGPAPRAQRLSP